MLASKIKNSFIGLITGSVLIVLCMAVGCAPKKSGEHEIAPTTEDGTAALQKAGFVVEESEASNAFSEAVKEGALGIVQDGNDFNVTLTITMAEEHEVFPPDMANEKQLVVMAKLSGIKPTQVDGVTIVDGETKETVVEFADIISTQMMCQDPSCKIVAGIMTMKYQVKGEEGEAPAAIVRQLGFTFDTAKGKSGKFLSKTGKKKEEK